MSIPAIKTCATLADGKTIKGNRGKLSRLLSLFAGHPSALGWELKYLQATGFCLALCRAKWSPSFIIHISKRHWGRQSLLTQNKNEQRKSNTGSYRARLQRRGGVN